MQKHLKDLSRLALFFSGLYALLMLVITAWNVWPVTTLDHEIYQLTELNHAL